MDTILRCNQYNFSDKALVCGVCIAIICTQTIFINTPLLAEELKIAHSVIPQVNIGGVKEKIMEELSPEVRKKRFDEKVKLKYPKAIISDIEDGVKHVRLTKYYNSKPVKINLIEINPKVANNIQLIPVLSASGKLQSRKTITSIAKSNNAIVAINGTYFKPQNGIPLGTLMINEKIYTGPVYNRAALGIFDNGFDIARVELDASVTGSNVTIKVDNINQPRMLSTYVLVYTSEWGNFSPYAPKYGMSLRVADGKITTASANPLDIPENGFVISGPKKVLQPLLKDKDAKLNVKTIPEWKNVKHIISGGPYLVKNGEIYVDMTDQKLAAIGGRNPRTAIGYTEDNNLILAVVDGREGSSIGMTLMELANFMKASGCIGAINLDGGGSTVMYLKGNIVNNPNVKGGIPISNALILSTKKDDLVKLTE